VGEFVLDDESKRTLIFIAYDTGFAGVKSLIEHAIALDMEEDMHLYRIACKPEEDYLHNVCRSWSDAIDNLYYHPFEHCMPLDCDDVTKSQVCNQLITVLNQGDNSLFYNSDVYLSGIEPMVENLGKRLLEKGLPEEHLKIQRVV
jgi:CDP-4-dehydro-6-deoxyglucose reductase